MAEAVERNANLETLVAWAVTNALLIGALVVVGRTWGGVLVLGGVNAILSGGAAAFCAGTLTARWGIVYRMHAVQSVSALLCLAPALIGAVATLVSPSIRAQFDAVFVSAWSIPVVAGVAVYLCTWLVLALLEVTQREIAQAG
ncbi:MAG: hypothetical protein KDD82_23315 [Planctomycetes bacterium]|nr:hypothetical protein [Planctomycetota bacterium]